MIHARSSNRVNGGHLHTVQRPSAAASKANQGGYNPLTTHNFLPPTFLRRFCVAARVQTQPGLRNWPYNRSTITQRHVRYESEIRSLCREYSKALRQQVENLDSTLLSSIDQNSILQSMYLREIEDKTAPRYCSIFMRRF